MVLLTAAPGAAHTCSTVTNLVTEDLSRSKSTLREEI